MAILIDTDTTFLIQGITGREGTRALEWMQEAGVTVAAGVTPGKGGQKVHGVSVYNTVAEALELHPEINATSIYVPPQFVLDAARESIQAKIPLIHIITENVPTQDTATIIELARLAAVRVVGPSSLGIVSPGQSVVGSLTGAGLDQYLKPGAAGAKLSNGGVAVLSKSGGMAGTIAGMLTNSGIPQTTVVGLGGDRFIGTTFADLTGDITDDDETKAVVVIGEFGGSYEEDLASAIAEEQFNKPVVAYIAGIFAETLPQGVAFGHAGAIVSKTEGTRDGKITALSEAGAHIAETPSDIVSLLENALDIKTEGN